ncbi:MAG: coproporphyrinogen III oxidase, partial [Flavobacteriales bacterium]
MNIDLIRKYNVPGPRYTSYPTVPNWDDSSFSTEDWKNTVIESFEKNHAHGLSIYIHLPFCESLCT